MKKRRNTLERGNGMEVEKDNNNNNSEGIKGDIESEGECKDSKRGNNDNDNIVAEEKDNPLEMPNDELEAQFNACIMEHKIYKSKMGERHG